jgi:hypothetical protein
VKASVTTVRERLRAHGLWGYIARRKPLLTPLHRQRRLQWCRERKNGSILQWGRVIFTYESSFNLIPNSTRVFIRRLPEEEFVLNVLLLHAKPVAPQSLSGVA